MTNLCNLCPNNCNVDRATTLGRCHSYNTMKICRIAPHFYEEPIISGTLGSGTIFFSGCSMDCEFCQNYLISKFSVGKDFTPNELAGEIKTLEESGVHNINLVTPTHFSHKIIEALQIYKPKIPIVYNTSGYEKPEIVKELNQYVDIYLVDMKYGDDITAEKYSKVKNYCYYNLESIRTMVASKNTVIDNDIMEQGVIVRHLVLPNNLENSKKVIKTFADNFLGKAILSVMSQFFPCYKSTITRKLKPIEYKYILSELHKNGIEDCYIQELDSASESYVPDFKLF